MFDIDGTAVPDGALSVESAFTKEVFAALPSNIYAIAATGRTADFALPITSQLTLSHDAVISNGAQVMNSNNGNVYWQELLSENQVVEILQRYKVYNYQLCVAGDPMDCNKTAAQQEARASAGVFLLNMPQELAQQALADIIDMDNIYAYISEGWHDEQQVYDVNIGQANARKDIALKRLFGKYAIDASKMVAIGDGVNDIDVFTTVGYRIAVANAHPRLLELADEIVPSQEDDGLASVVQRFL